MKSITALRAGLVMAVILLLSGCLAPVKRISGRDPHFDGNGTLVIKLTQGMAPQGVSLMAEGEPTFVRVRVHGSGVDLIEDQVIPPGEPREVALRVPAGTGYTVDAILYRSKPGGVLPVSGAGRKEGVTVLAGQVAEETIAVSSYSLTFTHAPASVTVGSEYVVRGIIEGLNIWGGRVYFKMSDTPWASDDEWRPGLDTEFGQIVDSGPDYVEIEYEGLPPAVDAIKTFYYGFELWADGAYYDNGRGMPLIALYVPSVDASESLMAITVKPF